MADRRADQHRNLIAALVAAAERCGYAWALDDHTRYAAAVSDRMAATEALNAELAELRRIAELRTPTGAAA